MGKTLVRRVEAVEERMSTDLAWRKPELSTTVEPRTARLQGMERGQRGPTRQVGVDQRRLNNDTRAQGKKRKEKKKKRRRNSNRRG
jgi:hypothetical protein